MPPPFHFEVIPIEQIASLEPDAVTPVAPVILVVDDEIVIADTLVAILRNKDYAATAAYSGEEALDLARALAPDFLLSDVRMPGMTGVDLACAVKNIVPECKILLFSGHATAEILSSDPRCELHGFPLLHKPLHPRELLGRLSSMSAV